MNDIQHKDNLSISILSLTVIVQGDSKLLSGFLWPVIFKSESKKKKKLFTEYESVTQNIHFITCRMNAAEC
jgi:hypothetical protein